jgi:formylglycine-generating enzyme required for sulfatase activity
MTNGSIFQFATLTVDPEGHPQARQQQSVAGYLEALDSDAAIRLELVAIPAGVFLMGAPDTEAGWHSSQSPQHAVTISPFWMGRYPVTQQQWRAVAALPKVKQPLVAQPSCFAGDHRPVEQVAWEEAIEFCDRLTQHTGRSYRLPSEAEWEYACRANTATPFHFGETITTDLANYSGVDWEYQGRICSKGAYGKGPSGIDRRETTEVGSFGVANAFGLYDMHGQVREWCQDCWHGNYNGAPTDGSAWINDGNCDQRMVRGGSWNSSPKICRSAFRGKLDPASNLYDVGFRVVRVDNL